MRNIYEVYRRIKERPSDPRKEEAKQLAASLREKMQQVVGEDNLSDQFFMQLNQRQSERLLPSAENAPPVDVYIMRLGEDGFICTFQRVDAETEFTYDFMNDNPSIGTMKFKKKLEYPWERNMLERVTKLVRRDASKIERQLHALRFGHKIADVLLEIKGESPNQASL